MTSQGVTFDTGMLVALERRRKVAWDVFHRLRERRARVTVPTPVLGEWWRGRTDIRDALRLAVHVEPLTDEIARLAGEALASVNRATTIDAFVMASASLRGDLVYTGDVGDFERLRAFFPGVRVLSISGPGLSPVWGAVGGAHLAVQPAWRRATVRAHHGHGGSR